MATLKQDQFQSKGNTSTDISGNTQWAEVFTPSVSGDLDSITIGIRKTGTDPADDLTVEIQETAASPPKLPTGVVLASETISASSVSVGGTSGVSLLQINFSSPAALTAGTVYAIVLKSPGSSSPFYRAFATGGVGSTSNYYTDGERALSTNGGSSWAFNGGDLVFLTKMSVAVATPGLDQFIAGSTFGGGADRVETAGELRAQTFVPSVSVDLSKIKMGISRLDGQTTGSITVDIQETTSGEPNGSVLATETINDTSIATSSSTVVDDLIVTFSSPPSLSSGVTYAVVVTFTDASGSSRYNVDHSGSVDQYASGQHLKSNDGGSSWNTDSAANDLRLETYMLEPTETTQTIDSDATIQDTVEQLLNSDAFVGQETTQNINSDTLVVEVTEQNINSDAFVGEETTQTINSDATIGATTTQTIDADAFVGQETEQTVNSDAVIQATQEQTIDSDAVVQDTVEQTIQSDANITATTIKQITSNSRISVATSKTIQSDAIINVRVPKLQLFSSADLVNEIGTESNPIVFNGVIAGQALEHPDNPFLLWNDKGGILNAQDARNITVKVVSFDIQDELVGTSDGNANQMFTVAFPPVVESEEEHPLVVRVGGQAWTLTNDLSLAGQFDEVYEFDFTTGTITFGDDFNGKIPAFGSDIEVTYTPDKVDYGAEIEEFNWFSVKSSGVISNTVSVLLERQISSSDTTVQTGHAPVTAVTGVFLGSDPNRLGTNFFTGGSFDSQTGEITLGSVLPSTSEEVLIDYDYTIGNDAEPDFGAAGQTVTHTFENPIPKNNAKQLFIRLFPSNAASPSGVMNIKFKLKITYTT